MGWQERNYDNRINYGGNPFRNPILSAIFGSVPLGTWFGIRVRVHAALLWYVAFQMLQSGSMGWTQALFSALSVFLFVLLHEFGHCFGARMVGGHADEILLWPLGGLAFTNTERTIWARFVTVVCGPLVTLILAAIFGAMVLFYYHVTPPLNPLFPFMGAEFWGHVKTYEDWVAIDNMFKSPIGQWVFWAFSVNWMLLFFNLLPIYPFDGGQLFQIALWKPLGYHRSTRISCIVGMVGAVLMAIAGILTKSLMLVVLAIFGFMACRGQLQLIKYEEAEGEAEPYDLSAAWDNPDKPRKHRRGKIKKRWFKSARKQASREQAEQARIDSILAKVKEKGLHSLSWWDKRALRKATERQRQRDLAERL